MVAYEGAVGSYIPGLDTPRGKPSKALVAALVVVSAAHAGLFAYLAYQKYVTPTQIVDPPGTIVDIFPPPQPPPPKELEKPPAAPPVVQPDHNCISPCLRRSHPRKPRPSSQRRAARADPPGSGDRRSGPTSDRDRDAPPQSPPRSSPGPTG
jgi:protein TonB